jgi:N-succinyldiaminopimelate aminotransferase
MNPFLSELQPYPFEKLAALKAGVSPPAGKSAIVMSIGEPKHPSPKFIKDALTANIDGIASYPTTVGLPELRQAIAKWLCRRFDLMPETMDAERNVLPVNGTREALFAIAQCCINAKLAPYVLMPNPFYQIYEGAAWLAGAKPWFINVSEETLLPDFDSVPEDVFRHCQLLYLCSPGNPTGAVMSPALLVRLIELSLKYNFVIASDECYSELYPLEERPPAGILQAAAAMGLDDYSNCLAFHSLSKRSSVPGLRSGFVAGDAKIIERFRLFRTYHGCAMPLPAQMASIAAWQDEEHVVQNRALYREKFARAIEILSPVTQVEMPEGGFYLWLKTGGDDTVFARDLFAAQNVTVLPGSYLSRTAFGVDPGGGRVRIALVPAKDECLEAARRIAEFVGSR